MKASTFINYSTKECLHFSYFALSRHVNCIDRVSNLVVWSIDLVWFSDDDPCGWKLWGIFSV